MFRYTVVSTLGYIMAITAAHAQNTTGSSFKGYHIAPTTTEPIFCPTNNAYTTSGTLAGCCNSASCAIPTTCVDANHLVYNNDYTQSCPHLCSSMKIFQPSPSGTPAVTEFACYQDLPANTLYRELPVQSTLVTTTTASFSSSTIYRAPTITVLPVATTDNPDSGDGGPALSPGEIFTIVWWGIVGIIFLAIFTCICCKR